MTDDELTASREQRLYDLVEALTDRCREATPEEQEEFLAEHAEFSHELRELLPALQALAQFESGPGSNSQTPFHGSQVQGVLGDFRILRELGRGGMGVVYEAEQISLGRRVALKVLPFAAMADETQLKRFKNEAFAAAQLDHPHIVDVYGVGCDRGVHHYAMRYIEGRNLGEILRETRQAGGSEPATVPSIETATLGLLTTQSGSGREDRGRTIATIGLHVAEALAHAHDHGVIHRDIKPSNLLVDVNGKVWVTDFGLAQIEADPGLTVTGNLLGTLRYMSPEQAAGRRVGVDHRTDIYSLGATLYELLTGSPVYPGGDRKELLRQILEEEPVSPRRHDPSIPVELETIVIKSLGREPVERYETAGDLAADLRAFLEHRPIRARRPTAWERVRKWCRRHRGLVTGAGIVLASVVIVSLASALVIDRERQERLFEKQQREQQEELARIAEQQLEQQRYVTDINLATQAWERADFEDAQAILSQWIPADGDPDNRGFEWHLLWQLLRATRAAEIIGSHDGSAYFIALSPEGLIATAGVDGIRLWNLENQEQVLHLTEHRDEVNWVSFSPDGRWMASASDDRTAIVWDTETWTVVRTIDAEHYVLAAQFSPDASRLAVLERSHLPSTVAGWEQSHNRITVFDTRTWEGNSIDNPHRDNLQGVCFSPDSTRICTVSSGNGCMVHDIQTGELVAWGGPEGPLNCIAHHPSGEWIVCGANSGQLHVVSADVNGSALLQSVRAHDDQVEAVAFSTDGKRLLSAARDGVIRVWRVGDDGTLPVRPERVYRHGTALWCVQFAPNQNDVVAVDAGGAFLHWKYGSSRSSLGGREFQQTSVGTMAFLGTGDCFAIGGAGVNIRRTRGWQRLQTLVPPARGQKFFVATNADGTLLAAGSIGGEVYLWDAETLKALHHWSLEPSRDPPWLSFSPDSRLLTVDNYDGPASVFSTDTGVLQRADPGRQQYTVWSPDGRYGFFNRDGRGHVIEAATGGIIAETEGTGGVAWSADGAKLALVSKTGTVIIWEAGSWREITRFVAAPERASESLAFSPDGRTLAVAGKWDTVHLWNVATAREVLTLPGRSEAQGWLSVQFSRDGKVLAATGRIAQGTTVKLWMID